MHLRLSRRTSASGSALAVGGLGQVSSRQRGGPFGSLPAHGGTIRRGTAGWHLKSRSGSSEAGLPTYRLGSMVVCRTLVGMLGHGLGWERCNRAKPSSCLCSKRCPASDVPTAIEVAPGKMSSRNGETHGSALAFQKPTTNLRPLQRAPGWALSK